MPHQSIDLARSMESSSASHNGAQQTCASTNSTTPDLEKLSRSELLDLCTELQTQLRTQAPQIAESSRTVHSETSLAPATPPKAVKHFDASRHSTRFVAFKISYLGHNYNGFEHANRCFTPLPTIEEVLWKAFRKARLISPPVPEDADTSFEVIHDPSERERKYVAPGKTRPSDTRKKQRLEISWEGCQYSKCGRTDRGVSAFGQVIGIRVRSNAPLQKPASHTQDEQSASRRGSSSTLGGDDLDTLELDDPTPSFDPLEDELPYMYILNMLLPPDIRILAWCPFPPDGFDARFSCLERRYKYLFTNPAFCPTPGPLGLTRADGKNSVIREGWLDIDRMRQAAKKLEGLNDYRNLSQIDASKQMPSCQRRITFAGVEELDGTPTDLALSKDLNLGGKESSGADEVKVLEPKVYAIVIHGTAFLWHQVRCITAVLFLVGQGLESPDVIDSLLDIAATPGRPHYAMADDAPLVLWDCVFPSAETDDEKGLNWIYAGDKAGTLSLTAKGDGKFGPGGLVESLWEQWQDAKLKEAQIGSLLSLTLAQGDQSSIERGGFRDPSSVKSRSQKVFEGANRARFVGHYQPLMTRPQMETLDVLNTRYRNSTKGQRRQAKTESQNTKD